MDREILKTENLSCSYQAGTSGKNVLGGVNISLRAGDVASLKGPSGSGKTTLLWALASMIPAESGKIFLDGLEMSGVSPFEWRSMVALVNQKHTMLPGTVRDNLIAGFSIKRNRGKTAVPSDGQLKSEMDSLGLDEIKLDEDSSKISVGQGARIAFLRSFLIAPRVLLLDETTSPLDRVSASLLEKKVYDFASRGGCVIVVAHSDEVFKEARKYYIDNGRISAGQEVL